VCAHAKVLTLHVECCNDFSKASSKNICSLYQGETTMNNKKIIGIALLVVGVLLLIVSLAADVIGIGLPGFGLKQIAGAVAGVVVAVIGFVLYSRK
jgi:hypothetical protein